MPMSWLLYVLAGELDATASPVGPHEVNRLVHPLATRAEIPPPSASYSESCQPTPMPSRTRPPDSVSSVEICFATSTG